MKKSILFTLCAGLALASLPVLAQNTATPSAVAGSTDAGTTDETPVSVEVAISGLKDDAKFSAASSAAETATEARIVYVSELQAGATNATVEQLRQMAADKAEALEMLREKVEANSALTPMLEEQGNLDHMVSAALDQDGMLLIFVDDEHQM